MTPPELLPEDCLEHRHPNAGPCCGPVAFHEVPGRFGRAFPRCDAHAEQLWDRYESRDSLARWANSDVAPGWFDPTAAGERWDDDY